MRITGKLDYLEMPVGDRSLNVTKSYYAPAFVWPLIDNGPTYSAFSEGLGGGLAADIQTTAKPLCFHSNQLSCKPLPMRETDPNSNFFSQHAMFPIHRFEGETNLRCRVKKA